MSLNPFSLTILPAPISLERDVECFRLFKYDGQESLSIKVAPIAAPGIVFQQREGSSALTIPTADTKKVIHKPISFIYGPRTQLGVMHFQEGPWNTIQVILRPHALKSLLGINALTLTDGMKALNEFAGKNIDDQLIEAENVRKRVDILTDFLLAQQNLERERDVLVEDVLQTIHDEVGTITKRNLLERFRISERQLDRRFTQTVGVSIQTYIRIRRFNEAIRLMKTGRYERLIDIAYALNFYDQSHFIRDLKEFTGIKPKSIYQNVANFHDQGGFSYT
jgi:AraC-like DNA-binding protein